MADLPFSMLVLFVALDFAIAILGIALSMKKVNGSPLITVFAGIMMFALIALTAKIDVSYSDPQPSNTTQNGGILTCATITNTICTPTAITKSFSYLNSTNQLTARPDPIPNAYAMNQENIWIFLLIIGIMWIIVAVIVQVKMI